MNKINNRPEWNDCIHPNVGAGAGRRPVCPDCQRAYQCSVSDALAYIDATVQTYEDGKPDLSELTPGSCVPVTGYCCVSCEEEFPSRWEQVLDHIRQGTVQ
ncbi:hypothetical protein [Kitasatospora sp. NPDC050463]|uniref:hypothetical protein n=1 Tax=Kitasatospora sp. NPDC050463 TaxID=3155786 RepID=UPI0033CB943D